MPDRHLPVRPNLRQLRRQAKDLLREYLRRDPSAVEDFRAYHPRGIARPDAKLADAQLALARSYGVRSWPRLVVACRVTDAIWRDDIHALRDLVTERPALLHEMARGTQKCNWGPPMSYAANLGRDDIIQMLQGLGATDLMKAADRATLQGQVGTARKLFAMMGSPRPTDGALGGPAYTLNVPGGRRRPQGRL